MFHRKVFPQAHVEGSLFDWNPYLMKTTSKNLYFVWWNSLFLSGKAFNQQEAPFSVAHKASLHFDSSNWLNIPFYKFLIRSSFPFLISEVTDFISSWFISRISFWVIIYSCICFVTAYEILYCMLQCSDGIMIPNPPSLVGGDISFLSRQVSFLTLKSAAIN